MRNKRATDVPTLPPPIRGYLPPRGHEFWSHKATDRAIALAVTDLFFVIARTL